MQVIRYAILPVRFNESEAQAEVRKTIGSAAWLAHLNRHDYTGDWQVLALRSPGGSVNAVVAETLGNGEYSDTPLMSHFPSVVKLMANLNCAVSSVRFMNLRAGATIKQHRDRDLAFENGEARLHFPVITNPEVGFYIDDEKVEMQEGSCYYLNANRPHRVLNLGLSDRIHLVVDCKVNDWLTGIFDRSKKYVIDVKEESTDLPKIIAELRRQHTPTADLLADQLSAGLNKYD